MKVNLLNVAILTLSSLISVACSHTEVKYVPVELPLPPPLEIQLTEEELTCVSDNTYSKIVLLAKRVLTLEEIIRSTQPPLPQ
jgi:hypothetical protein